MPDRSLDDTDRRATLIIVAVVLLTMFLADISLIGGLDTVQRKSDQFASSPARSVFFRRVRAFLTGLAFGSFGSQLVVAVGYAALGDGSSPRRLLYTTFVVAIFANALILYGMWLTGIPWSDATFGFLIPMLFFYVGQIPFWAVRWCFGWTIKSPWSKSFEPQRLRFTLAHLLGWSVFLAIPLGISTALSDESMALAILMLWVLAYSAVVIAGVYLAFVPRLHWLLLTFITVLVFSVMAALELGTFHYFQEYVSASDITVIITANPSGGLITLACMRLAYRLGFRLMPFEAKRAARQVAGNATVAIPNIPTS